MVLATCKTDDVWSGVTYCLLGRCNRCLLWLLFDGEGNGVTASVAVLSDRE